MSLLRPLVFAIRSRFEARAAFTLVLAAYSIASAQTLARPGWVGSGMAAQVWSKHAVLYEIDVHTFAHSQSGSTSSAEGGTLKGVTQHLDYIKSLGVDAVLLEPLSALAASEANPFPIDPALGTVDDFDELSQQASRHNLRILLTLPGSNTALARFWLTRGVAGFYLPGPSNSPAAQSVRKLLPGFVGQRVLITDADLTAATISAKPTSNELIFDSALLKLPSAASANIAAELRVALEQSQALLRVGNPVLATDALGLPRSAERFARTGRAGDGAKLAAAVLLLNRSVALIYAGQELGLTSPADDASMMPWGSSASASAVTAEVETTAAQPHPPAPPAPQQPAGFAVPERYVPYVAPMKLVKPAEAVPPDPATAAGQELDPNSLLNFYRQLIQLHHGKAAIRDGEQIFLSHDDVNVLIWVRRPASPSLTNPAIVAACNPTGAPVRVAIKQELTRLGLRGSFLRNVLRTGTGQATTGIDPLILPPFGVFVGELRY